MQVTQRPGRISARPTIEAGGMADAARESGEVAAVGDPARRSSATPPEDG